MIPTDRAIFTDDHNAFRDTVRRVLEDVIAPHMDDHERNGTVEREAWEKVGAAGLLCPQVPEPYGGLGLDFSFNVIVTEEIAYMGSAAGFSLQSDIVADYLVHYGSEEQKRRYLPGMVDGTIIIRISNGHQRENAPPVGAYYSNCDDARAAGVAPLYASEPGYRLEMDGDGDGVACEPYYN